MKCGEARARLVELVYEEPGCGEREPLEAHVAACAECRGELGALRAGRAALARLDGPGGDAGMAAGVGAAGVAGGAGGRELDVRRLYHVAAVRAQRQRRWWKRAGLASAAVAAALLVMMATRLRVEVSGGRAVIAWGEGSRVSSAGAVVGAHRREQQEARAEGKVERERVAGAREVAAALGARVAEQERALGELEARLQSVGELAQLATRELLRVDGRHTEELARLRGAVERLRQSTTAAVRELNEESDLRWRITVHELGSRAGVEEVSVVEAPGAGGG